MDGNGILFYQTGYEVCFWHLANVDELSMNVCFRVESGHRKLTSCCLLLPKADLAPPLSDLCPKSHLGLFQNARFSVLSVELAKAMIQDSSFDAG